MIRTYKVTVTMLREYSATIAISAKSQEEADRMAIAAFNRRAYEENQGLLLGLRPPWQEHETIEHCPEIDTRFRCVDCGKDTGSDGAGEYYMVGDDVWAASGLGSHDGMLCLACLEDRIGRPLAWEDFTALRPLASAWERHIAARSGSVYQAPEQLEMLMEPSG